MIPAARTPAPPYQTPPVKEGGVGAGVEGADEESPLVEEEEVTVSEGRGHEGVDEEPVELLLLLLRHRLQRRLLQLLHTLPTASPSKGQVLRIPLHHQRGPVRWRLVREVLSWRGMATSVIPWHGMTAHQGIRLFRVRRIVRQGLRRKRLRANSQQSSLSS